MTNIQTFTDTITSGQSLSKDESFECLSQILSGNVNDEDSFALLQALCEKGESTQEIEGFVKALKAQCLAIKYDASEPIVDVCGTGGSHKQRFNISTCVAFVLAAGGVKVAKHGNYGSTKPNGSFNFLEELNIAFDFNPQEIEILLDKTNLCFLFARKFHPTMKYVANARKKIGKRTIFNLIGPLANPLDITHQIIGVSSEDTVPQLIEAVQQLGIKEVKFCLGGDGRDEISIIGKSKIITVTPESVHEDYIEFSKDIDMISGEYKCGNSQENAMIFTQLCMEEDWDHDIIKHIAINAAAGFQAVGQVKTLKDGYNTALSLFKDGSVTSKINHYKQVAAKIELGTPV